MNPTICLESSMKFWAASISVHLTIKIRVIHLGIRVQGRLEDMHLVHPDETSQRAGNALHVSKQSRLGRTHFHTGGQQTLHQAMIAEIAFIGDPRYRMEIANPVRAGLDAVPAADTAFGV